jgi:hypothetical protein
VNWILRILHLKQLGSCVFYVLTFFATVKSIVFEVRFCIVNSHILILTSINLNVNHNFKLSTFLCYQHALCNVLEFGYLIFWIRSTVVDR